MKFSAARPVHVAPPALAVWAERIANATLIVAMSSAAAAIAFGVFFR